MTRGTQRPAYNDSVSHDECQPEIGSASS